MTSKRSSHVYINEQSHVEEGKQHSHLMNQDSRTGSSEDMMEAYNQTEGDRDQTGGFYREPPGSRFNDGAFVDKDLPLTGHESSTSLEALAATTSLSSESSVSMSNQPLNFGVVVPGVYRSSYPKVEDFKFLASLNLKTIVTLVKKDELDDDLRTFVTTNGIRQVIFNMRGTKKEAIPASMMSSILGLVNAKQNQPILIHCNHGKHRTGCVVAALRRLDSWDTSMVLDEYRTYADPKIRESDVEYITRLDIADLHMKSMISYGQLNIRFNLSGRASFPRFVMFATLVLALWSLSGFRMSRKADELRPVTGSMR